MAWIKRNRKAMIAAALVVGLGAIATGVYLEWKLAPKVAIRVAQDGERIDTFVYRRDSANLEPCRGDMRRLIDSFEGNDFSFEVELVCPGGRFMVAYVQTYRVDYAAGTVTITDLPMGGDESEVFSSTIGNADELQEVLSVRLSDLLGDFRETTRARLHVAEAANP